MRPDPAYGLAHEVDRHGLPRCAWAESSSRVSLVALARPTDDVLRAAVPVPTVADVLARVEA